MEDYTSNLHVKFDHPQPANPHHYPFKHATIVYRSKIQYNAGPEDIPPLNAAGILRVQAIVGTILFYERTIDKNILVALIELGQKQASATKATNDAITQLLYYEATYLSDGITFCASNMVLSAHSDAEYLNVSKARSQAGAHIMLSEDVPVSRYNVPVIAITEIIK